MVTSTVRGIKRKPHESQSSCLSKKARIIDLPCVKVFTNRSGNIGISVDDQTFRRKNIRKDGMIVWRCNRGNCYCIAVTTSDHQLVNIGEHHHQDNHMYNSSYSSSSDQLHSQPDSYPNNRPLPALKSRIY